MIALTSEIFPTKAFLHVTETSSTYDSELFFTCLVNRETVDWRRAAGA